MMHIIGEITLSISLVFYLVGMWPQIIHTEKTESTNGFSKNLHICLFIAACFDLIYVNGQNMEWQARLVTISLIINLIIQQIQFLRFNKNNKGSYIVLILILNTFLLMSIYLTTTQHLKSATYNTIGFISIIFYHLYTFPQIYTNSKLKSTKDLSSVFIYNLIIVSFLDLSSAICLSWNWPSIIGPIFALTPTIILIAQIHYYKKVNNQNTEPSLATQ